MTSDTPPVRHRMRRFVDHRLQSTLVLALVVAQLALVAVCVWQLDAHLHAILDAETYRVHFNAPPSGDGFRREALQLLVFFAAANLALVFLVELAWKVYVGVLLQRLRMLLRRVQQFDFAPGPLASAPHPLLELAQGWRAAEHQRLLGLRRCRAALEATPGDAPLQHRVFAELAALLPEPGAVLPR